MQKINSFSELLEALEALGSGEEKTFIYKEVLSWDQRTKIENQPWCRFSPIKIISHNKNKLVVRRAEFTP